MALNERTLDVVAGTIARAIHAKNMVSGVSEEDLRSLILHVLREDREAELAIDDQAKRLMQKHAADIARGNMDTGELFRKFRAQIAKEKGFTL